MLPGGKELPFPDAPVHNALPHKWEFDYDPGWTAGDQVSVSIRTEDVQNRYGQVLLKARRSTTVGDNGNIVYGKTHSTYPRQPDSAGISRARGDGKFGPGVSWELLRLNVITDKTGDTDPVWITATFRAPNQSDAWTGYWEGQFDDFHTLFLRWIYHEGGVGKGAVTYTLPLRAAATEGGIQRSRSGRDVSFTWVRTYKEFQRRHLDLANHSDLFADMLTPPKPATARSTVTIPDTGNQHGLYTPAPTVTSVEFTSNPGADQVYGPYSTIQATLTFDQDVTVRYAGSKRNAASVQLEMNGETRTAYYERTDGNKVIFQYTVKPGDEAPVALKLPLNSLKLFSERGRQNGSIRNSEGTDAVLDHNGILSTKHRVDAVVPEFSSAQVSNDGAQVMVTLTEDIKSPSILRAFGLQTGLLQSLALDVRVDGEFPVRSDAAVSGDTVTLTMSEPITQGQTVTVSYDNLFTNSGPIFSDLHGNHLPAFNKQPATNHSTVAGVTQPGGGMALSRTDLIINEGSTSTYTVLLTSQPTADVTVSVDDHPPGRATVSPTSLTFTTDNWNTPQTVTISSTEDSNYLDRWVILRHTATGDDYRATAAAWLKLRDNYNLTTTTPNTPATGRPTISGTPEVGQTLTLDISAVADAEGLTNASYTYLYQWHRNGAEIPEATDTSYTLVDADEGKTIKVKVSFTDDANNAESRTSAATVAVAPRPNNPPTGAPTINGTPQVRRTLSVDTSSIADADGMETAVFRYQWLAATEFATLEFHGENSPTYTVPPAAAGLAIKVKVFYTDDRGHTETLTSEATEVVGAAPPNSDPTGLLTISGTPRVDETLTADTSAINDANGLTNVSYTYVWMGTHVVVDETSGISYTIGFQSSDQTSPTYALTPADQGATIKVRVTFTDDDGYQESLTSAATEPVAARPNTEATGAPTISGTPQVGETLTADVSGIEDADGLTNVSYRYQWLAGGLDIEVATSSSYLLTASEQGQAIQVKVTFTDDADNQESLTSAETLEVAAKPNTAAAGEPTISGTPQVDETLTAGTSAISDEDGLDNVSYQYQWLRDDADIAGQTSSTYEVVPADEGKTIKVRVTFQDDAGNAESLISGATTAVLARSVPVDALTASFANMPADHNGENFTFQLTFSENVDAGYARIRNHALTVTGATIDNASRITQGSNQGWNVEVNPTGNGAVSITLPETTNCSDAGAICTDDSRKLSHPTSATVAGPPAISVSDATVQEAEGAVLVFTATLSHASSRTVTVDYATSDGTAVAGSDYTAASGALTFNAGDTSQTVQVTVLTDSEDESQETLTLTLSNPSQATLDDASGAGAIENGESSSGTVVNSLPTGLPTVSGTPQVGETLTTDTSNIDDEDGLTNVSYSYQWIRSEDGNADTDIEDATDSTYTLTGGDVGKTIQVKVTFTDDADNQESLTSEATETVAVKPNTAPTGLPTISGTPQVDQTLTADTSPIDDEDGLTNATFEYQWIAGGSDIGGATGSTYTLTASEQGQTIQVRVTFTDDADNEETLTSEATVAVAAAAPASLTAAFHDLPDSHDGSTAFTFRILFSEDVGISYVNMRDDAFSLSEGDVTGARRVDGRNDLWEITVEPDDNSDVGITLPANRSCTTTGAICTREDSPRQLTNSPTATVTGPAEAPPTNTSAAGAPTISGTPQVEQTLTADTSPITDEDGLTNVSYSYQWIAGGSDIAGATGSTYTLTASEQGQTIQVRVTFTDDADNEETLTSEATAEVTAAPAPLTASLPDSRFQSARHNGADDRPQVIVAFSLPVASFEKTTPSVSLTGAAVSSVRRHQEDGLENAWIFFLDSDGDGDIVFSLATGQPCDSGGICTEDGEMLSEGVQVTLPGPEEEAGDDQQTP